MAYLENQDVQLFVYFTWKTRAARPLFDDEQIRQAAHQAIQARIRSQFCRVLAIHSTPCQTHLIASFPASLAIKFIVSISRDAAEEAIFRGMEMLTGTSRELQSPWEREFTAHTMSAAEATQAQAYLQQRLGSFHLASPKITEAA